MLPSAGVGLVADGCAGDYLAWIGLETGRGHAERGEDLLVGDLVESGAVDVHEGLSEEEVAGVAVQEAARFDGPVLLAVGELEQVVGSVVVEFPEAGDGQQGFGVADATVVLDEVADGDVGDAEAGQDVANGLVQGEKAVAGGADAQVCGDLFGDGADVEGGLLTD